MNMNDISLQIILSTQEGLTPRNLHNALDEIERVLLHSDEDDVSLAAERLGLPDLVKDAALWRLRQMRNERLLFQSARTGSVELFAVVAATSYFVLERTLGESMREGYTSSDLHARLVEYIRAHLDSKFHKICDQLEKSKMVAHVEASKDKRFVAVLMGLPPKKKAVPSIGAMLDRLKKRG